MADTTLRCSLGETERFHYQVNKQWSIFIEASNDYPLDEYFMEFALLDVVQQLRDSERAYLTQRVRSRICPDVIYSDVYPFPNRQISTGNAVNLLETLQRIIEEKNIHRMLSFVISKNLEAVVGGLVSSPYVKEFEDPTARRMEIAKTCSGPSDATTFR